MLEEEIDFSDDLWVKLDEEILIIGAKQDLFEDVSEIWGVDLPNEGDEVSVENICGEIETDQGPINIYSPLDGEVLETNTAILDAPDLLFDDSTEEGWLLKVKPFEKSDLEDFLKEIEEN